MGRADNAYSRFVAWLKVLLPLTALLLLSSLFLVQRGGEGTQPLPFSEGELAEMARGQGLGRPQFSGLTADGREITFSADSALPRLSNRKIVDVRGVAATLDSARHGGIDLTSDAATIDQAEGQATLRGAVQIATGSGYTLTTETLRADLTGSEAETPAKVHLTGPQIEIEAGAMRVTPGADGHARGIVVFNQGVRLIYQPQAIKDP